jgi:hypothetical protein
MDGNGEDSGTRRHDFADQLVAEFDGGADQVNVALFQDALFFAGFKQRLDIDGGFFFGLAGFSASEATEKKKRTKTVMGVMSHSSRRMGQTMRRTQRPFRRAIEEQRGNELIAEDHDQHHAEEGLGDFRIGGAGKIRRAVEEHGAEFESDDAERELLQDRRADGGVFAREAELGLDELFPGVEIFFDLAGEDFAELGVDAADVGGQRFDGGEEKHHDDGEGAHGRLALGRLPGLKSETGGTRSFSAAARSMRPWGNLSLARSRRSRRAILPSSTS